MYKIIVTTTTLRDLSADIRFIIRLSNNNNNNTIYPYTIHEEPQNNINIHPRSYIQLLRIKTLRYLIPSQFQSPYVPSIRIRIMQKNSHPHRTYLSLSNLSSNAIQCK